MPHASVPRDLRLLPFRGRDAVGSGALTRSSLRGRTWQRLLPDVYINADVDVDHRAWCRAALLWAGSAATVAGGSAAHLWGVVDPPSDGVVELILPLRSRRVAPSRLRIVRSSLDAADVSIVSGIRLTTPTRTAFDVARRCRRDDAVVTVDALLGRNVVRLPDVMVYAQAHRGAPGIRAAMSVLHLVEPLTESPMETRLRLVIVDGGLPRPMAQHVVTDGAGRLIARVDLAYPQWRIAIEYDGDHHRGREEFRNDQRRANALRVAGWTVLRFSAADIWRRPDQIVAHIRALIPA